MRGLAAEHGLTVERLESAPDARRRQIHSLAGVLDPGVTDPAAAAPPSQGSSVAPADDPSHQSWLNEVAAHRVPVLQGGPFSEAAIREVLDPQARERLGVAQRRELLRRRGAGDAGDTPAADARPFAGQSVSVLLATNRPERVVDVIDRVVAQTHTDVELVAALHAPFDERFTDTLRERMTVPLHVVDASDAPTLGDVLNRATERASGEIVTKMDDDDLYDQEHLFDLLDALDYSGAMLVGKGSEFVYLAEIDTTIRRFPNGVETANRNLAGGTLMIRRDDLRAVGGWQPVPRGVDQALIDDVVTHGAAFHRTHGLGFILNRHGTDHTWDVPVDYFLQQAVAQWPGLALGEAGFTGGPDLDRAREDATCVR